MWKLILLLLFAVANMPALAQILSGQVRDAKTKLPISYASIGLTRSNTGTTADHEGRFSMNKPSTSKDDSLIISSVGYKPAIIPLHNDTLAYKVLLDKKDIILKEVVIRKYGKKLTLPWNKGKSDFTHTTIGLNTQCARLLTAPEPLCKLKAVTVALRRGLFSQQKNARFRIRIYDYDSVLKMPGTELCDSVIEVVGRGMVTVNLEQYQVVVPQKSFYVAIQWLFIDENKDEEWKIGGDEAYHTYRPGICMQRTKQGEGNTWMQMHNQRWIRFDYDSSITATVLY